MAECDQLVIFQCSLEQYKNWNAIKYPKEKWVNQLLNNGIF